MKEAFYSPAHVILSELIPQTHHVNSVKKDGGHWGRFPIWGKPRINGQSDFTQLNVLLIFQTLYLCTLFQAYRHGSTVKQYYPISGY